MPSLMLLKKSNWFQMLPLKVNFARRGVSALYGLAMGVLLAMTMVPAQAQSVVAFVNDQPITSFDIDQRILMGRLISRQSIGRKEALQLLIDDQAKLAEAKRVGYRITDDLSDAEFERLAKNNRQTPEQFSANLKKAGIQPSIFKAKLKADIAWDALVKNHLRTGSNVTNSELEAAVNEKSSKGSAQATLYHLYPVVFITTGNNLNARHAAANAARASFKSCTTGLETLRATKDVVVKEETIRSSNSVNAQMAAALAKMPLNSMSPPYRSEEGVEMLALCKKVTSTDRTALRTEVENDLANKKGEARLKAYMAEIRSKARVTMKN